jgi:hypothetical protein
VKNLLEKLIATVETDTQSNSAIGQGLKNIFKGLLTGDMNVDLKEKVKFIPAGLENTEWFNKSTVSDLIGSTILAMEGKNAADKIELQAYRILVKSYAKLEPAEKLRNLQVGPQRIKELAALAGISVKEKLTDGADAIEVAQICEKYYLDPSSLTDRELKIFNLRKQKLSAEMGLRVKPFRR